MAQYNPESHHRRSIRLKEYDYAQAGMYFVTVCAQNRECLFGEVIDEEMRLNGVGQIVEAQWQKTASLRPQIKLDAYVVMPNHFHGIIFILNNRRGVLQYAPTRDRQSFRSPSQTVGAIIRGFKSAAAKEINLSRGTPGLPVWQRNYHEHIIRDENELNRIREYIVLNPARWKDDEENPINQRAAKRPPVQTTTTIRSIRS